MKLMLLWKGVKEPSLDSGLLNTTSIGCPLARRVGYSVGLGCPVDSELSPGELSSPLPLLPLIVALHCQLPILPVHVVLRPVLVALQNVSLNALNTVIWLLTSNYIGASQTLGSSTLYWDFFKTLIFSHANLQKSKNCGFKTFLIKKFSFWALAILWKPSLLALEMPQEIF